MFVTHLPPRLREMSLVYCNKPSTETNVADQKNDRNIGSNNNQLKSKSASDEPHFPQQGSEPEVEAIRRCIMSLQKLKSGFDEEVVMGQHLVAEIPAVLLLGFRVASGIEMDIYLYICLCLVKPASFYSFKCQSVCKLLCVFSTL